MAATTRRPQRELFMPFFGFHPVIERWFQSRFQRPTEPQELGWPSIAAGDDTLIAAPTGSGKTLTAFLAMIDRLLKRRLSAQPAAPPQEPGISVVYVSPLRALSNDMHRNLEVPLAEITRQAREDGFEIEPIRVGLRTGDTSSSQRQSLVRRPPEILVTTPESLYLMLTGKRSREVLRSVETVIVDEIHALIGDKRGSHLALTLERLEHVSEHRVQRIGLSATQKPIERTARFLIGAGRDEADCRIVDVGHQRELDLAIEVPPSELGAVCSHEQWAEVNQRLVQLIEQHRSTLLFVNTRRLAERVTHQLAELLGEDAIGSHHGSLAAEKRLDTEQRLKAGRLKAVVATASLELGLDVGHIDLVVQLGSPRSIATFLQRIGRSGHSLGLIPKGRLFALTRDELVECMALMRAVRSGTLDAVPVPEAPIDVLAQQIVAEVAAEEWSSDALFALFRRADPYRALSRTAFDETVQFLSEGITHSHGRSRVYVHHDAVGKRLRGRKGAGIAAVTNGGAIPEIGSFRVVAEPDQTVVGSLDEDFAIESMAGDVFLLGNNSWRIQHVRGGDVTVTDAHGAPPTIPFWRGEAPGRTIELSAEVSRLREELETRLGDKQAACRWLVAETECNELAAEQTFAYAAAQKAAVGFLPTHKRVLFERFFDDSGGMQMVVHAPFGGRITRAWGLAMRKRFCRSFDFELQATADDDGFILSLGPQHSFPLESMFGMLTAENARRLLEQAVLFVPMFQLRWRWNTNRALLVLRRNGSKKVPPALQRFRSDDLLTAVFPKLTGCQENVVGELELPDHPLARQTMDDCLFEALDIESLEETLRRIEAGEIELVARDTREPSPFSYELLNANPYAFLDGGEIQERRTRAVATRRSLSVDSLGDLGRLDPLAIEQVRGEAQPPVRDADELHDVLLTRIVVPSGEFADAEALFAELTKSRRATVLTSASGRSFHVAAERLAVGQAAYPESRLEPEIAIPDGFEGPCTGIEARVSIVRGLVEVSGPVTTRDAAERLAFTIPQTHAAFEALEGEGLVLRGRFTPPDEGTPPSSEPVSDEDTEWCHRRLLARIHRLTLNRLRREIEPVPVETYLRFLLRHHGLLPGQRFAGVNGVYEAVSRLQGIDVPAVAWEKDILPARVAGYETRWLDELCLGGEVCWSRLYPPAQIGSRSRPMKGVARTVPISLYLRADRDWISDAAQQVSIETLSGTARDLFDLLSERGAMFASDLADELELLPSHLDDALGTLISRGLLSGDGFGGLRNLITTRTQTHRDRVRRPSMAHRRRRLSGGTGRWSLAKTPGEPPASRVEEWAWQLLRRWGVVMRDVLVREAGAPRWWELLHVYRRLEARGEIRGGRFVAGVGGEQFALGETVRALRRERDEEPMNNLVVISAADPVNLVGIVTDHSRVPTTAANRVALLDGHPLAALHGGKLVEYEDLPPEVRRAVMEHFGLRGTAVPRLGKRAPSEDGAVVSRPVGG